MAKGITIKRSLHIYKSPEDVWDFTQSFENRALWDPSVVRAKVIRNNPTKVVKISAKGRLKTKLKYKLEDRPYKTTVAMIETKSPFIKGGGGSWIYEPVEGGTLWIQKNSLRLRSGFFTWLLRPFIRFQLTRNTQRGMWKVKKILED